MGDSEGHDPPEDGEGGDLVQRSPADLRLGIGRLPVAHEMKTPRSLSKRLTKLLAGSM